MSPEDLSNKLDTLHRRVSELARGWSGGPAKESVEQLRAALEELRVADEELRQQNEELTAAHLEVEVER
ncbi:MAG TPA: hypothetical protein VJU17_03725, partial [Gemmatimonadales bacterium]|nr:hypothetical protein [Gemmatimonadales bacterium]